MKKLSILGVLLLLTFSIQTAHAATKKYPAGCTAYTAYSSTTGLSCTSNAVSTSYSANTLAAQLSPRLATISCNWYNRYGAVLFSKTSNGILGIPAVNGSYFINTVLGGVIDTAWTGSAFAPSTCTVSFPGGSSLYAGGYSTFTTGSYYSATSPVSIANTNVDYAQVNVTTPNPYLATYAAKENFCSARPTVNEPIAVMGWASNGSGQVLSGQITGTNGYYDTINLSLPAGMQGSTAVSLAKGCIIGQINAVGQIADTTALSYVLGWK
jgi:hypothetical protein